jgi:MFS family permease
MIAGWVAEGGRGKAFGFHRAMDNGGAALGALLAAALVGLGFRVEQVILIAAIPGLVSLLGFAFTREPPSFRAVAPAPSLAPVPRRLFAYLGPVALFGLANSTDAFLLLKLTELKAPASLLPLAWLLLQAVKAAVSFPAGWVADVIGSSKVVIAGWTLYAISYIGLAFAGSVPVALAVIGFYGLYHGFSEGAERALLADLAPTEVRGRAFGLYHAMSGISALVAGLLFGALWNWGSSRVAFLCAGSLALVSAVLLIALLPVARRTVAPAAPA